MPSSRIAGILLVIAGIVLCGVISLFVGSGVATHAVTGPGAVLGIGIGVVLMLLLVGPGAFLIVLGGREAAEMADVQKKERLVGMIQSAGKVSIANAAVEMKMTRDEVKNAIFDLVNQGLFTGYINWQEGYFYSKDASQMQTTKCPNCGGTREQVGKGIVKCQYCGAELFLPSA